MSIHRFPAEFYGTRAPIRIRRGESGLRGTHWRHLSHIAWGRNDRVDEDQLREFLRYGNDMFRVPVEVEDPYKKNEFRSGFLMHPESLAIIHKSLAHIGLKGYANLGRLSIVWPFARVEEGASLGVAAEVRPQAHVGEGAHVGDRSLVSKYARLSMDSRVGSVVFVGSGVQLGKNSEISSGAQIARGVTIGDDVQFGQGNIGREATLGVNGFYDSGVRIGHHTRIGDDVVVGEGVRIAPYSTIGQHVIIGAGNTVGQLGIDYPTAFIDDGTFMPAAYEAADGEDGPGFVL